jgi:SAM-dependent methyltransferase
MHKSSILRMKWFVDHYASKISKTEVRVLDVGSYDVNGSYRHLFSAEQYQYTGMDMEDGPNVDIVIENPYDWGAISTDSFDVVISGQTFEHIEFFWITMSEMTRVLKKDGLLCLVAPNGFGEHRFPVDCYRFFTDGMVALAKFVCLEPLHAHTNCAPSLNDIDWYSEKNADSMLIAKKPYSGQARYPDLKEYKCVPENQEGLRSGLVPYPGKKKGIARFRDKIKRRLFRNPPPV